MDVGGVGYCSLKGGRGNEPILCKNCWKIEIEMGRGTIGFNRDMDGKA